MKTYNKKGLYNSYDKNHKERDALDYYATPTEEVVNILKEMQLNFSNTTILEPCCGGGHMVKGIKEYCSNYANSDGYHIYATDVKDRNSVLTSEEYEAGEKFNFLSDSYPCSRADYVIMNPPYSIIEPFVIRGLEIAEKGLLVLARLQFLEGEKRYTNILKDNPPTDVYVYVDRIKCYKNGDFSNAESSAQAYAWFYWDKSKENKETKVHWLRRSNKK